MNRQLSMRFSFRHNLSFTIYLLTALVAILIHSGFWFFPNIHAGFLISQNLGSLPLANVEEHYLMNNFLTPFIFGVIGNGTFWGYVLFNAFISLLFIIVFAVWFYKRFGPQESLKHHKLWLVLSFPVFFVPLYWIGLDGSTLLLMLIILISQNLILKVLFSFVLAWQHFEQSIIAFGLVFGIYIIKFLTKTITDEERKWLKELLWIVIGLVFGKLALMYYFYFNNIELLADRFQYMQNNIKTFLQHWQENWYWILWSIFSVMWFVIFLRAQQLYWLVLGAIGVFFFTTLIGDQTRVASVILFPLLFHEFLNNEKLILSIPQKVVLPTVILGLIVPAVYVWGGPSFSLLFYDIDLVQDLLAGTKIEIVDLFLPFK